MYKTQFCLQLMYLEDVLTVQLSCLQAAERIWFYLTTGENGEEYEHYSLKTLIHSKMFNISN